MRCDVIAEGVVAAVKERRPEGAAGRAARGHERRARQEDPRRVRAQRGHRRATSTTRRRRSSRRWGSADGRPRRQEHARHLPGHHRQDRHVPRRAGDRSTAPRWSAASRPGKGGATHLGPAGVRHRRRSARQDRRERVRRSTCRRRAPPTRSSKRSTPGCALIVCITEGIPVLDMVQASSARCVGSKSRLVGAELPGRDHARRVQDRHHARLHPQARARSASCRARARSPTKRCSSSPPSGLGQSTCVGIGGDPVKGTELHRRARAVRRRPGDRGDHHDRRDRRHRRGAGRRSSSATRPSAAARSRSSASSPAGPRRRASAWATPARSSPAARATRRRRSPRSRPPGSRSRRRRRGSARPSPRSPKLDKTRIISTGGGRRSRPYLIRARGLRAARLRICKTEEESPGASADVAR